MAEHSNTPVKHKCCLGRQLARFENTAQVMVKLWAVYKKPIKHSQKSDYYYNVTCYKALSHNQPLIISMQTSSGGFCGRDRKTYSFSQIFSFSKQVQKLFSDSFDTVLLIMLVKSAQKDHVHRYLIIVNYNLH